MESAPSDILDAEKPDFELIGESEPKVISVGKIKGETRGRKAGGKNSKSVAVVDVSISDKDISQILEWAFRIPKFFGWGAHWELSKTELKDLTDKTRAVLNQFPDSILEKYGAATSKFFAPASLIISVATLCFARYQETLLRKKYEFSNTVFTETGSSFNGAAEQSQNAHNANGFTGTRTEPGQSSGSSKADVISVFGRTE